MFAKTKKKKIYIVFTLVIVLVASFFAYRHYLHNDFKRAYENGATTYEQFHALTRYGDELFGKQYVDDVKKAGYYIDDVNLKMMERIPILTSKNLGVSFVPEKTIVTVRYNYMLNGKRIRVFQQLDKNLQRDGQGGYYLLDENGNDIERIELTEAEEQELTEIAIAELKDLLSDVYHSMYPEQQ